MTAIPFLDLKRQNHEIAPALEKATLRVVQSGRYLLGPETEAFEAEFARWVGTRYCVAVANGLEALMIALKALHIGPGDQVLVPTNTFVATWLAVSLVGAEVVGVEPDPHTLVVTADRLDASLTPRTTAVIPVHLYGRPCPMAEIMAWAKRRGIAVVEDAAQAHGARWGQQAAGSFGDAGCWSFYPSKNLGALGDAGAITTNDRAVWDLARRLRNYGSQQKYYHDVIGLNSRMSEMNAAILRVKLGHLEAWNQRRHTLVRRYVERLQHLPVILPPTDALEESAWHLFVIRTPRRGGLQAFLSDHGIETQIHYPVPPHRQRAYRPLFGPDRFPVANRLADEVLSLPLGPYLSLGEVDYVADALCRFFEEETREAHHGYSTV
ncbi:MAG: DegT/DnrJ/EryC1/StrS family aminotransferase [Firmicutes bacterium]|nr:DegT/DnrJ/EryC1/StrS family aminotransferase [Bacillota bacterium]